MQKKVHTLGSAECELSVDLINRHPVGDVLVRACKVWLLQCPS